MERRRALAGLVAGAAALALVVGGSATPGAAAGPGQEQGTARAQDRAAAASTASAATGKGQPVQDGWIVVLRPGTRDVRGTAQRMAREHGGTLRHVYEHALQGFAGRFPEGRIEGVRRDPDVQYVEQDTVVVVADTQTGATSGLDRIDQRDLPLDGSYTDHTEGAGVHTYVIDTGVRLDHVEFSGRLGNGYDAVTSGGNADDCNGHGTHVAGTVAGTVYGVADKATVHPVRVLGCDGSGTTSGVIAGVDWVRSNHVKPAVANMSLGGGASSALDTAVTNAIEAGVTMAVAAGNDNRDACNYSPARVGAALTVGSTTSSDARSSFSNYGTCLDLFAPGSSITSAWHTGSTATRTISGTSMATPHVAGVAALYLSADPSASPATVRSAVVGGGTTGKVTSAGSGSPDVLLYNGITGGTGPSPSPAPVALANGGFESGDTAWTQSSSPYRIITTDGRERTGSWASWFGGYNGAKEFLEQTVTVPSNGVLGYHWQLTSNEGTSTAYDHMRVQLYSTSGSLLTTLRTRSNTAPRNAWYADSLSLSAYAGQTVKVRFAVTTDSSVVSSFFVDDVTLTSG